MLIHTKKDYILELQSVRGLACLIVCLSHAGNFNFFYYIRGAGVLAVFLFFGLSGFLMEYYYAPLGEEPLGKYTLKKWGHYFIRRLLRVYPTYLFIVLVAWLARESLPFFYPIDMERMRQLLLLQSDFSVFWSIPVEIKFYCVFPVISTLMVFIPHTRRWAFFLLMFIMTCSISGGEDKISLWYYLNFFIVGMAAAYGYRQYHFSKTTKDVGRIIVGIPFICLAITIIRFHYVTIDLFHFDFGQKVFYSLLIGSVLLGAAYSSGWINKLLNNIILRFLGDISFSLYLTHTIIYRLFRDEIQLSPPFHFIIAILLSLFVAIITCILIEKPFRNAGRFLSMKF